LASALFTELEVGPDENAREEDLADRYGLRPHFDVPNDISCSAGLKPALQLSEYKPGANFQDVRVFQMPAGHAPKVIPSLGYREYECLLIKENY